MPIVTKDNAIAVAYQIIQRVTENDYYIPIFNECREAAEAEFCKSTAEWTPDNWGQWAQAVWEALPDNAQIRREPFFLLCDLAEAWCEGDLMDDDDEGKVKIA